MKTKLAVIFTILGIAGALVPTAGAKPTAPHNSGGGPYCVCLPPAEIQ